ncbi:hypothetical protein [Fusibacter ferrireducens]|uniref:Uncharacterized protein n=1 Tax=Fusibacter ferrireducens TaxID=2785058 RepID=A0ABR9ZQX8_9FIRM|nr:hypothetical protein [Fusibacter ferrireducens]MBF4692862.1 hypothetical protein [Fusibacter ferrireducens]
METYTNQYQENRNISEIVSMKEWIITLLILCIPIVNIVMPFVWAFSSATNPSKANFFKAQLIMAVAIIIIWFLFLGSIVGNITGSMY